jgi:pimeloyl-ACP methyl ester carboxylesterase
MRHLVGLPLPPPYTLAALADDAAGLLGALDIAKAQVLGVSMGGMVAQHLAYRHPQLVSHLHLWMTTSGARLLPMPHRKLLGLMTRRPRTKEQALQHYLLLYQALGGSGYRTPEAELRQKVAAGAARAWRPQATLRQLLAIAADGDRSRWLRELKLPVSILHGSDDPMLPLPHARHLARQLRHAKLRVIEGWGHDLPDALLPELAQTVERHPTQA